jgi:hypothetical protein
MALYDFTPPGAYNESASACWERLSGIKQALMTRVERYAALTIPKVCLPDGFDVESMDQTHDYQSLGAQAVNHVVNKLMTAMFAPSRPFFRVAEGKLTKQQAAEANISETDLNSVLAKLERDGSMQLDKLAQRPKLYQVNRHLVVTGNTLMILDKKIIRNMGLKYWCVKRDHEGGVHTLVIREQMCFNELDQKVQATFSGQHAPLDKVCHYRLIRKVPTGHYYMTQWVNEQQLPKEFDGKWTPEKFPYRVLAWDLADESDYGTGLVEEYAGDFEALSVLSEAIVTGAVVGTEFRWVANPNGVTSIEDLRNSVTGDTIPGSAKDVTAITPPVADGVKMAQAVSQEYIQRISRGFLLSSAVTRDAERVTAEEVRMQTMELESSFGGTYSMLAPSIQKPVANWMLASADTPLAGTDLDVVIITGLDALSRNGDLENLKQGIATLAGFMNVPEGLLNRMKWQDLAEFVGQGVGVDLKRFIMSNEEFAQVQQAAAAQNAAASGAEAGAVAGAEAAANPQQPQ